MEKIHRVVQRIKEVPRATLLWAIGLVLLGVFLAFAARFMLVEKQTTHYHANFALYVNGERDNFANPSFYEEVASCSIAHNNPKARVHMHDNVSHVVHVHDDSVTWGHFFENISYSVSRDALLTDAGLFVNGQDGKTLTFILNGQPVSNIANKVIGSEDVLLIDFSNGSPEMLKSQYDQIMKDAAEYNQADDPSACTGTKDEPLKERFLRTLGVETDH